MNKPEKRQLNSYLKTWQNDINRQETAAGRREARFSFSKKFKRDYQPERVDHYKTGKKVITIFKIKDELVHIDLNKKIDKVTFYILP